MHIDVFDKDDFGKDDFLGWVELKLDDVNEKGEKKYLD